MTKEEHNLLVSIAKAQIVILTAMSEDLINSSNPRKMSDRIHAIGRALGNLDYDLETLGELVK